MQRIVRRIQVEDDLAGRAPVCLEEQIDEQAPDRYRVVTDLVIARRLELAQLQSIERRLAGNRRAIRAPRRKLAGQQRHHRIMAQLVVIVEVLIAERNREHPLTYQCRDLVLDQLGAPHVVEARCKPIHHSDRTIRGAQHQRSGIRRDQAAIKSCFHRSAVDYSKIKTFRATLCRHRGSPRITRKSLQHSYFR